MQGFENLLLKTCTNGIPVDGIDFRQSRQSGVLPGTIEVLIQMLRSAEGRPARSEKNCKVNPVSFYFFGNFGGSLFILKKKMDFH